MEYAMCRVAIPPQLRNRRSIAGAVQAVLFDIATEMSSKKIAMDFFASHPYLCKSCFSVLTKYGAISEALTRLKNCLKESLSTKVSQHDPGVHLQLPFSTRYSIVSYYANFSSLCMWLLP